MRHSIPNSVASVSLICVAVLLVVPSQASASLTLKLDGKSLAGVYRGIRIEESVSEAHEQACPAAGDLFVFEVVNGDPEACFDDVWVRVESPLLDFFREQPLPITLTYDQSMMVELKSVSSKEPKFVNLSKETGLCFGKDPADRYCLHLRRSVADKNAVKKPAQLQFTDAVHGDSSWSTDVGLTLSMPVNFGSDWQFEWGGSAEYHRQTATSKEQNSLLVGLKSSLLLGDITEAPHWGAFLDGKLQYKQDLEKNSKGMQILLDLVPVKPLGVVRFGQVMDLWSPSKERGKEWLQLLLQPVVGFGYDGVYDAPTGKSSGDIGRFYSNIEAVLYPAGGFGLLDKRIELFVQYSNWVLLGASNDLGSSGDTKDLFKTGARYYFDSNRNFGVSLSYLDGQNPREAKPKQEFWQAALELKF